MSAIKTLIDVPADGNYLPMAFDTQEEQVSISFSFQLLTLLFFVI